MASTTTKHHGSRPFPRLSVPWHALAATVLIVGCSEGKQGSEEDGDDSGSDTGDDVRLRCETLDYYLQLSQPVAAIPPVDPQAHGPLPAVEFPTECSVDGVPSQPPPCDGICFVTAYCAASPCDAGPPSLVRVGRLPGYLLQGGPLLTGASDPRRELGLLDGRGDLYTVRFDRRSSNGWRHDPTSPAAGLSLTNELMAPKPWLTKYDLATGHADTFFVSAAEAAFGYRLEHVAITGGNVLWDYDGGHVCKLDAEGGEYLSGCGAPGTPPCEPEVYLDHLLAGEDVFYANGLRYVPSQDKVFAWTVQPYDPEVDQFGPFPFWNYNHGAYNVLTAGTLVADDTVACYNLFTQDPTSEPDTLAGYGGAVVCFDGESGERVLFWRPEGYDFTDYDTRPATALFADSEGRLVFAPTVGSTSGLDPQPVEYHDIWRWDPISNELEHLYSELPSFVPHDLLPGTTAGDPDRILLTRDDEPGCVETLALPP